MHNQLQYEMLYEMLTRQLSCLQVATATAMYALVRCSLLQMMYVCNAGHITASTLLFTLAIGRGTFVLHYKKTVSQTDVKILSQSCQRYSSFVKRVFQDPRHCKQRCAFTLEAKCHTDRNYSMQMTTGNMLKQFNPGQQSSTTFYRKKCKIPNMSEITTRLCSNSTELKVVLKLRFYSAILLPQANGLVSVLHKLGGCVAHLKLSVQETLHACFRLWHPLLTVGDVSQSTHGTAVRSHCSQLSSVILETVIGVELFLVSGRLLDSKMTKL